MIILSLSLSLSVLENDASETTNVETFINESFYETLIIKIKDEVKIAVCNELKVDNSGRYSNNRSNECNCNNDIIETLNKHVDFLQKELISKDAIINMLVNDKCATNADNNKPESISKNKTRPIVNKNMT